MSLGGREPTDRLDWAVASEPFPGETESGDSHIVRTMADGVLVAAVDALGHGREAAPVTRCAVAALMSWRGGALDALVRHCHRALIGTRGVVLSVATFDAREDRLSWLGVGNIRGSLLRWDRSLVSVRAELVERHGIVGLGLPSLRISTVPVRRGDLLVLATDGIRRGYIHRMGWMARPQQLADRILADYASGVDDALVLVARYRGA